MKKLIAITILAAACGMQSADNEAVGQVKKVIKETPLVCPDYTEVDVSLGVMRNGVGSLSKEDVSFAIDNAETAKIGTLKKAAESGAIVRLTYDVKRVSWCWPDHRLVDVAIDDAPPSAEAK